MEVSIKYRFNFLVIFFILFFNHCFAQKNSTSLYYSHLTRTELFLFQKEFDSANFYIQKTLSIKKTDAALFLAAKIHFLQGKFYSSLIYIEDAIKLNNKNIWYFRFKLKILQKLNKSRNAAKFLLSLLKLKDANQDDFSFAFNYLDSLHYTDLLYSSLNLYKEKYGRTQLYLITRINLLKSLKDSIAAFRVANELLKKFPYSLDSYTTALDLHFFYNSNNVASILLQMRKYLPNEKIYSLYKSEFLLNKDTLNIDSILYYFFDYIGSSASSSDVIYNFLSTYSDFFTPELLKDKFLILCDSLCNSSYSYSISRYFLDKLWSNENYYLFQFYFNKVDFPSTLKNSDLIFNNLYVYLLKANWKKMDSISQNLLTIFPLQPQTYLYLGISQLNEKLISKALHNFDYGKSLCFSDSILLSYFDFFISLCYKNQNKIDFYKISFQDALDYAQDNCFIIADFTYYTSIISNDSSQFDLIDNCLLSSPDSIDKFLAYTYSYILYKKQKFSDALDFVNQAIDNSKIPNILFLSLKQKILKSLKRNLSKNEFLILKKYEKK